MLYEVITGLKHMGISDKAVIMCAGPERSREVFDEVMGQMSNDDVTPVEA